MTIKDFLKGAEDLSSSELEHRLFKLLRSSYKYENLSSDNRKILLKIIKKYLSYIKRGIGITSDMRRREINKLRRDKVKLDLSDSDIDDIEDFLREFKK